jgi:hypothetical protein
MIIEKILIKWDPGTGATTIYDWMIAKGNLLKKGEVVAILAQQAVTLKEIEQTVWEFPESVDADELALDIYDVDYPHTMVIDGQEFSIPEGPSLWKTYSVSLAAAPEKGISAWWPMSPKMGPPLPQFLNVTWPWLTA